MKTIKQLFFALTLLAGITSAKAQSVVPSAAGKTAIPKIMGGTVGKNEDALNFAKRSMRGQADTNVRIKKITEDSTNEKTILTPEQKKKHNEDTAKANAKLEEMTKNSQGAIEVGRAVIQ